MTIISLHIPKQHRIERKQICFSHITKYSISCPKGILDTHETTTITHWLWSMLLTHCYPLIITYLPTKLLSLSLLRWLPPPLTQLPITVMAKMTMIAVKITTTTIETLPPPLPPLKIDCRRRWNLPPSPLKHYRRRRRWKLTVTAVETLPPPPSWLKFCRCRRWNITAAAITVEILPLPPLKIYCRRRHRWKFTITATAAVAVKILPPPPLTHYCCGHLTTVFLVYSEYFQNQLWHG